MIELATMETELLVGIELHAPTNSTQKLKLIEKGAPGFELETSGPDTILSCMHQPVQPKSLSL
jgi:hypothetical protein